MINLNVWHIQHHYFSQLIVATNPEEASRIKGLFETGQQNEVPGLSIVEADKIRDIEPNCKVRKLDLLYNQA